MDSLADWVQETQERERFEGFTKLADEGQTHAKLLFEGAAAYRERANTLARYPRSGVVDSAAAECRAEADSLTRKAQHAERQVAFDRATAKLHERRMQFYAQLKLKYEHAAAHPWQSVEPDPPEPT